MLPLKQWWWKILAAVLLIYTFVAGLFINLGQGVESLNLSGLKTGQNHVLEVKFYKPTYAQDLAQAKLEARLRLNPTTALCLPKPQILGQDARQIRLEINLPQGQLPLELLSDQPNKKSPFPILEFWGENAGYASLQSAFFIDQDEAASPLDKSAFCELVSWQEKKAWYFPFLNILEETIRNLFFHVPMWFGMMLLLLASMIYSIQVLRKPQEQLSDFKAESLAVVGLIFGVLGILTGALWAKNTWGSYWSWDVKQNTSAVGVLIYLAYFVLRSSIEAEDTRARIAAVYNIFAFAALIPLLYVIPRMTDSLHPGMGGNPAFSQYDLDSSMRLVFYPAIFAWTLTGMWIASLRVRLLCLEQAQGE